MIVRTTPRQATIGQWLGNTVLLLFAPMPSRTAMPMPRSPAAAIGPATPGSRSPRMSTPPARELRRDAADAMDRVLRGAHIFRHTIAYGWQAGGGSGAT